MISNLKRVLAGKAVFIAASLLATASMASAADYEFKVIRASVDEDVQTVELIDMSTGRDVAGANIEVVHTTYVPHRKAALDIQRYFVPLQDHLNGKCAHQQSESPTNAEVNVVARVPGEFWPVWGTIDLGH